MIDKVSTKGDGVAGGGGGISRFSRSLSIVFIFCR